MPLCVQLCKQCNKPVYTLIEYKNRWMCSVCYTNILKDIK